MLPMAVPILKNTPRNNYYINVTKYVDIVKIVAILDVRFKMSTN